MPGLEHRYCIRHLHANMKGKEWKGKEFKDALWGAARAPNEIQFKYYLSVIGGMDKKDVEYIEGVHPKCGQGTHFEPPASVTSSKIISLKASMLGCWKQEVSRY
jgi:hypothetical protein